MSAHKRYNAFNPMAKPAEVLAWFVAPFTALSRLSDSLLETEEALREMRAEKEFQRAVGRAR